MHPTLDLFVIELPVYTALVMLGGAVGLAIAYLYLRWQSAAGRRRFFDAALIVLLAAWVGARTCHVALHWDYYVARPDEIAQFGLGGLAMRGAFIAGGLALAIYARVRRVSFWQFADASALGLTSGQALGWGGALAHGANAGSVSDVRFALDLPDLYGLVQPRFPLQHIEIAFFVILFVSLLWWASRAPQSGTVFLAYLAINSLVQLGLGTQRGDETVFIGVWRFDQLVDACLLVVALAITIHHFFNTRSQTTVHA